MHAMQHVHEKTDRLLELLGHNEEPFGVHYTNEEPAEGFAPKAGGEIFSREREAAGEIDWQNVGKNFSCIVGNVWLARKKKKAAWLCPERCGCVGGGFYSGMYSPYMEFIPNYVSTGIPGFSPRGERYLPTPDAMRTFLADVDPRPAPAKYGVLKPLSFFTDEEKPEIVTFFVRGEVLTALVMLAGYSTGNAHVTAMPFGAGCTNIMMWPITYLSRGEERAVIGGADPSCRKFLKPDEMTFSVPVSLYCKMLDAMEESCLTGHTWENLRKRVLLSQKAWREE